MPTYTGRHEETVLLGASPTAAAAAFADPDRHIRCHPELASAEKKDARTLQIRMKGMNHGPVTFEGHYTLVLAPEPTAVRWRCGPGSNVDVEGEAVFTPAPGGGSRMVYKERVAVQIEVNALVGKVLRPVVEAMMERGMKGFLARMTDELQALA